MEGIPKGQPKVRYASYLLRLWQVQDDEQAAWVASVQSTATGEQRSFGSIEALLDFVRAQYGESGATGDSAPHRPTDLKARSP